MLNTAPKQPRRYRYNEFLIVIHWVMALSILLMFASGLIATYAELDQFVQFKLYQWHKSLGVILILLLGFRVVFHIVTYKPDLPAPFTDKEKRIAKYAHRFLYLLMASMMFSGWLMVSSSAYEIPTIVFSGFQWPDIPGIKGNSNVESIAKEIHFFIGIALGLFVFAHVSAVIKHRVDYKINLITRLKPRFIISYMVVVLSSVAFISFYFIAPQSSEAVSKTSTSDEVQDHIYIDNSLWKVDKAKSYVRFSGSHAGTDFTGVFESWHTKIRLNTSQQSENLIASIFMTGSANTGSDLYDGTLIKSDWFASEEHPEAAFTSQSVDLTDSGKILVSGALSIRGNTRPIDFQLDLTRKGIDKVILEGQFVINRLEFEIGNNSDPDAEWVSEDIMVNVFIHANN